MVSYRGNEGIGLVHVFLTQEHEPSFQQLLRGMNCLKLDFGLKRELAKPDLARLESVGFKPQGKGHVWPVFQSLRPSWAPWPVNREEAIQLTEDLIKVSRFAQWHEHSETIYESHPKSDIPVVGLGEHPLRSEEIDWIPLLPPVALPEPPLVLSDEEADELTALPVRPGIVFEIQASFVPAASFLDESGRARTPLAILLVDRASFFVVAVELLSGDEPLRDGLRQVVLKGMIKERMMPERICVSDERLYHVLQPACARVQIKLEQVDQLVAASDALESLGRHLRGRS
jgi:hypothetical protein